jgi:hypothetical protein
MKTTTTINSVWTVERPDYHDFKSVIYAFKDAGVRVEYKEVGMNNGQYVAVFRVVDEEVYNGEAFKRAIKKMKKELEKD